MTGDVKPIRVSGGGHKILPMDAVEKVRVRAREGSAETEREDLLAVEEPLEIRLRGANRPATSFVTTMRTPGRDEDLAAGLLLAEGILERRDDLHAVGRPDDPRIEPERRENVVVADLAGPALERAEGLRRATVMGSACGVCGRTSIDGVLPVGRPPLASRLRLSAGTLRCLPEGLASGQSVFAATGGLHAAGLFDASGRLQDLAEDIGRHNATDKIVGTAFRTGRLPLSEAVLLVSGRAGFEIIQKAYGAGSPIVASVSAPSSLAVSLAEAAGITLVGFLRGERFNIYSHADRID
jgi:FdhD protein